MDKPKKIFINYRRKDVPGLVDDFFHCLKNFYGDVIFLDNNGIGTGEVIPDEIKFNLEGCELFLPIIGPNWDSDKHLQRLKDPKDWVRKEIELARALNKFIIPVLMLRDELPDVQDLPDGLKTGIFERKVIKLPEEPKYWPNIIRDQHEEIKAHANLESLPPSEKIDLHHDHQKLAYCLNHDVAIKTIKDSRKNRQVLFCGSGSNDNELKYFAERCSVNFAHTFIGVLPGARVHYISWDFNALTPDEYQAKLCGQIAEALPAAQTSATTGQPTLETLKDHFKTLESGQSYIFWAKREDGFSPYQTRAATRAWWDTWHSLLVERENQNIIVLLFTDTSWLQWLNLFSRFKKHPYQHVGHFKGKIHKKYLDKWQRDFINGYLQNDQNKSQFDQTLLKNTLSGLLKKEFSSLSFLRKSLPYDTAVDFLNSALQQAYRPIHKSNS